MLEHLANGVRMQPEHPGRFTNTHSFDVAGSANPAIQLHRVDPATFSQSIVLCTRVNVSGAKFLPPYERYSPPLYRDIISPPFIGSLP